MTTEFACYWVVQGVVNSYLEVHNYGAQYFDCLPHGIGLKVADLQACSHTTCISTHPRRHAFDCNTLFLFDCWFRLRAYCHIYFAQVSILFSSSQPFGWYISDNGRRARFERNSILIYIAFDKGRRCERIVCTRNRRITNIPQ